MICPNCSASFEEHAAACPDCGQPLPTEPAKDSVPPAIKDHLTLNIVLLVIACTSISCMPALATGILGVVFSSQVRSLLADGKLEEAQKKAKTAKYLAIATGVLMGMTVLFLVAYFAIFFIFYGVAFSAMLAEVTGIFGMLPW